jgi:hypothetical protein
MRGRTFTVGIALAMVAALGGTVAPAGAADPATAITLASITRGTTDVTISGSIALGTDATGPITVSEDGAGDASPAGAGLDLGNTTFSITTGSSNPKLIVETKLLDGNATAGGNIPFTGFSFPFVVDGDASPNLWLGGGSQGTNITPRTDRWVTLCNTANGWSCPGTLGGGITTTAVRWELPFNSATPKIKPGMLIEPGGANGGVPSSFAWPSAAILAATSPADRAASMTPYIVPGSVQVAIAAPGTPESKLNFSPASTSVSTGSFIGSVAAPAAPGTYTVHARSCWGNADVPTCVTTTRDQAL